MTEKGSSFVVILEDSEGDREYLSGFSSTFWPKSGKSHHSKRFKHLETAKYAAELCREKLNDDYSTSIGELSYTFTKLANY